MSDHGTEPTDQVEPHDLPIDETRPEEGSEAASEGPDDAGAEV